jgi:hypothetical protein
MPSSPCKPTMLQVTEIIYEGYAAQQLLIQLQGLILADAAIPDLKKSYISEVLACSDKMLVDGADETLQLLNAACQVRGM